MNFHRDYHNPIWVFYRKIVRFYNKQINNCYNLYYKLQDKPIIGPLERYKLQVLLEAKDSETQLLGISNLLEYSAGNDLLRHCLCRTYRDVWNKELQRDVRQYFTCGNVQLSENTKIQEILDDLKRVYFSIPEGNYSAEYIITLCRSHLNYIGYWMAYHNRIGSQNCCPLGEFERCCNPYYGNHYEPNIILIKEKGFFDIKTWDWRRQTYDYPVKAEEYWKTHKKPDLSGIVL